MKSQVKGQLSLDDYSLKEVKIRLKDGSRIYAEEPILNPEAAVKAMAKIMQDLDREYVFVVNLNNSLQPINFNCISIGSINSAQVPIPNVYKSSILSNATAIILLHNHPSGNLEPSKEDISLTHQLIQAGKILDIPLLDHCIVGGNRYISLKEHGYIDDEKGISVCEKKTDYMAERQEKMKELTDKLEAGVKAVFESEQYKKYLACMANFHRYSVNNTILIYMQKPDATTVASYTDWRTKFHRYVNLGEKGIKILAPCPYKRKIKELVKDENGNQVLGPDGNPAHRVTEVPVQSYKVVSIFDVSQTSGEDLPKLGVDELKGKVADFANLDRAIREISPVPIAIEKMDGHAKGYYSRSEGQIAIKEGMDEAQTLKTELHELAHSMLHSADGAEKGADRHTKEVEAESIAYVVSQHYGIDTAEYSFPYISGWSKDKSVPELKSSLEIIRKTSLDIIQKMDQKLLSYQAEKVAVIASEHRIRDRTESALLTL